MKYVITLVFLGVLWGCQKEDCITIQDKQSLDGNYYFLFRNRPTVNSNSTPNNLFIPDAQQSGEVSKFVYDQYEIGDTYCY